MKPISRILVAMDLTNMDEILLQYLEFWKKIFPELQEVVALHNIKYDFPAEANQLLKDLDRPLKDLIEEDIAEKLHHIFGHSSLSTRIMISQKDSTAHAIAEAAEQLPADMVLVGKKINYKGSGMVPGKLMRLIDLPILFLPETAYLSLKRILVPVDFSQNSIAALSYGINFSQHHPIELSCQHVYHIPMRYFPYIPVKDVNASMAQSAKKQYEKMLKKVTPNDTLTIPCEFTEGKDQSIVQHIYHHAVRTNTDFIIIGSKGKTTFVGSVTNGLSQMNMHIPLLVVKH